MDKDYKEIANELRKTTIKMIFSAQSSHVGSCFSCADILAVLYDIADLSLLPDGRTKDIVIVKSWAVASVYASLVRKGLLPQEAIDDYGKEGTPWKTTAEPLFDENGKRNPYIPWGICSMGFNLPAAVGFALAKKLKGQEGKVYCLISDGECQVGSTWESALIAAHHKLDNLVVIVDKNSLQAMGNVKDILNIDPLWEKWKAFGWEIREIDGHDYTRIENALDTKYEEGKPCVIIANTIKGKGVSFMEGENLWHYSHVSEDTLNKAMSELNK